MRRLKATLTLALALSLTAIIRCFAAEDPLMKEAHGLFEPVPSDAPAFKDNPTSPAKVELGKMLYFDPRLSQSHNISWGKGAFDEPQVDCRTADQEPAPTGLYPVERLL